MIDKQTQRLKHMIKYCEKIALATKNLDSEGILFKINAHYQTRDLCSFYLLQIGELTAGLDDDFKNAHSQIPWKSIKGFRNIVAHRYGTVDTEMLWDIVHNDIPVLNQGIREIVRDKIPDIDRVVAKELAEEVGYADNSDTYHR